MSHFCLGQPKPLTQQPDSVFGFTGSRPGSAMRQTKYGCRSRFRFEKDGCMPWADFSDQPSELGGLVRSWFSRVIDNDVESILLKNIEEALDMIEIRVCEVDKHRRYRSLSKEVCERAQLRIGERP